jgi:hypothetical protein
MKKLPSIHGLLLEAEARRVQATREAVAARSQTKDPRMAHEAGVEAERLAVQAGRLDEAAEQDADMVIQLNAIANFLRASKCETAFRALALRKIEDAEMILRREIGDFPENPKP